MNEQELCKKRLLDLSRQAEIKGIVLFSDFLNLNELNIYHSIERSLYTKTEVFGGYDGAERQMIAFIPDALMFSWEYPLRCIKITPKYPKFSEKLTHRDILGALMNLGIERSTLGDIILLNDIYYVFCNNKMYSFIMDNLSKIRHTFVDLEEEIEYRELSSNIQLEEQYDTIASNRIDCVIAKAFHLSRSESSQLLIEEKVFINGKCITNCNQSCEDGAIVSVRGKSRFVFESCNTVSKKGKLRVKFSFYK
jgi:RNA-binding protein YlmH